MASSMFESYDNSSTSNMIDCYKEYLIIGTTTTHTFIIDLDVETISKILVSYSQNLNGDEKVVFEKEFESSAINTEYHSLTFDLSEYETNLFKPEIDALVQLKVVLVGGSVLVSPKFKLEILENNNQSTLSTGPINDIYVTVYGDKININKFILLAGSENAYRLNFNVDSQWSGLTLSAIFKNTYYNKTEKIALVENSCFIPNDMIEAPCRLSICLNGEQGSLKKLSEWSDTLLVVNSPLSKNIIVSDE